MTTIAIAEGFRVCQSFLGAKLHDAKDPSSDLSAMLQQVVGSVFSLMQEYEPVWWTRDGARPVELFGFRFDVGLDPIAVDVERMVAAFERGCEELGEIWALALRPDTLADVRALSHACRPGQALSLDDQLWVRVVYEFACAYRRHPLSRGHLLRSLTPLYLARVASFVAQTHDMRPVEVEARIENLCLDFEAWKPHLRAQWNGRAGNASPSNPDREVARL